MIGNYCRCLRLQALRPYLSISLPFPCYLNNPSILNGISLFCNQFDSVCSLVIFGYKKPQTSSPRSFEPGMKYVAAGRPFSFPLAILGSKALRPRLSAGLLFQHSTIYNPTVIWIRYPESTGFYHYHLNICSYSNAPSLILFLILTVSGHISVTIRYYSTFFSKCLLSLAR